MTLKNFFEEKRVCSVVITYNPTMDMVDKIVENSLIFEKMYIVDNSIANGGKLLLSLPNECPNIELIRLGSNYGIAYALNVGLAKALDDKFLWAVTLDQDSLLDSEYLSSVGTIANNEKCIGIISPVHRQYGGNIERVYMSNSYLDVESVMMSGNLLSLNAYSLCGNFLNQFFIDYVDIEYCLRLRSYGFRIILTDTTFVFHELGKSKWYRIGNFIAKPTNHSAWRRYYISRNRAYLYKIYKNHSFIFLDVIRLVKESLFILLFEKKRLKKFYLTTLGIYDGLRGEFNRNKGVDL